ncbi:MBL fold metallo-hydrolase [Kineococcus sp. SYSU DK004]|uniref:MBL fold metallo-hydrolase n=1 Tax=Kineococcus sp. SYSU DK004 TaxID=3383125 RepID=UPI003D7C7A41
MSGQLRWLGHSTVVVDVEGVRVVTDPVLRAGLAHLRRRQPVPAADHSARAHVAVVSHLHHDHCDIASLRALDADWVVAPPGAARWLRHRLRPVGSRVVEAGAGQTVHLPVRAYDGSRREVAVTALPAHHDGGRTLARLTGAPRDAAAVGHLLEVPRADGVPVTVWALGDTGPFPGLEDAVLAQLRARRPGDGRAGADGGTARGPDVALVPVGGWGHTLGEHHLDPRQAARVVARVRPALAVPVHWGTLAPLALGRTMGDRWWAPGRHFADRLARRSDVRAVVLRPGQVLPFDRARATPPPAAS